MKAYIQSKSGNFNTDHMFPGVGTLEGVLKAIRRAGGFYSIDREDKPIYVPFEEVEYVGKSND
jgi:hypothetical protein